MPTFQISAVPAILTLLFSLLTSDSLVPNQLLYALFPYSPSGLYVCALLTLWFYYPENRGCQKMQKVVSECIEISLFDSFTLMIS